MSKGGVVIIGSGLGGLSCGVILAANGYKVTILEQSSVPGGCLQCFSRRGVKFETGMHYIGSAAPGQTLDRLLGFLGVRKDITLSRLDSSGYDIISIGGQAYPIANGREPFIETLGRYFPSEKDSLVEYFDTVDTISEASAMQSLNFAGTNTADILKYQLSSVGEIMDSIIKEPMLSSVLSGNLPLYAGVRDKTPFATHAFIRKFYNNSAFRIAGGSDTIAESLVCTLQKLDGQLLTSHKVTRIVCKDSLATGVVAGDEFFPADVVISDAHPALTVGFFEEGVLRPAFKKRVLAAPQTVGAFCLYLDFKEGQVPYMNSNYYFYEKDTPWGCEDYSEDSWPEGGLYMHFCHKKEPSFAASGVVISYMKAEDLAPWNETLSGRRGESYEAFKTSKAEKLLDLLERHFPGIRGKIAHYYTSTPLTNRDYTGCPEGSMYGILHDVNLGPATRISHRTRVPNVLQTGQNINSHGILGVLVGTIITCSELLGAENLFSQIRRVQL